MHLLAVVKSVSGIVKHVQHIEIIFLPGGIVKFFSTLGDRKNCWVLVSYGGSVPKITL